MQPKAHGAKCFACPLRSRPMCQSYIPPDAIALVVGEAPGINEIIENAPFVGETGAIFNHALAQINVDPRHVAKTNAVLCRPIGEDVPDEAIAACAGRLREEIQYSGVKSVIAMGNAAARAMDHVARRNDDKGVMARAGRTYWYTSSIRYTVTVNPGFLLRADGFAPNFTRHINSGIFGRENPFDAERVKWAVMTPNNADRILEYLYSFPIGAPMAYDVETDHLQWFNTPALDAADLLCVVLTLEDWRSVIIPADMFDTAHYDISPLVPANPMRSHLKTLCNRYNVIGHNVKFDQNVTAERLNVELDAYDDTMLMHHVLQELGAHGLKELGSEYLGAPDYEGALIDDWFTSNGVAKDKRRYSMIPHDRLYKYAAIDGALTLQLWRVFDAELRAQGLYDRPYRETVMQIANALPIVERTGIGIDRAQLTNARIEFGGELAANEEQMNAMIVPLLGTAQDNSAGELTRLMRSFESVPSDTAIYTKSGKLAARQTIKREVFRYNPKSPPQTHHVLYNLFGFDVPQGLVKPTGTNTGREALEALPTHPFIDLLRHHRRVAKMLDTYIEGIDRRADVNDTLHVDFRITGTEIGRLSASNGDHGIPRPDDYYGAMIRSAFTAKADEVFVLGDYSQAELRAYAWLAQVAFLLEKYRNGEDVHTETAIMLEKLGAPAFRHFAELFARGKAGDHMAANAAKAVRTLAKNINFGGLVYLGGPNGIAGMMGGKVSPQAIADVLGYYAHLMPESAIYAEAQYRQLRTRGYVETVFGRRRRFYVLGNHNEDDARKASVHMVVAGSAADLTNHSVVELVRAGVRVCHSVHDSIIARCAPSEAEETARFMQETMQAIGARHMPGLPWVADVEIAERWCDVPTRPPTS